jgi:amino acid adenylation domain-containing protein
MTEPTREERATPEREDVAVIGMAGRFPGARTVQEFWRNLREGIESVRSFTREELAACGVDPSVLDDPGYVNAGALLDDAEWFASSFFGYSPRDAELMDPQQRVFLECAWEALESAGYDPERCPGTVSVYAGIALDTYFQNNLLGHPELAPLVGQFQLTLGNEKDFVATRVAHKLNLRGAAFTVQSGCSTSLVATHLACQSLLSGECDLALVGGGRIRVPLHAGYHYLEGGVPSPDGHCRAFDADARGCVAGSGMAAVVLKRLSDAQRDGDVIHAVLRGSAINNDGGNKTGFTAPSVDGQSAAIQQALAMADVDAASIGYVEAHGTGTSLGDPIEIAALTRAYRKHTDRRGYCRIGSVKTNIGHLDAGAGVAGLIKAVLAVKHGEIPPSLNYRSPNPQIDFENSPFVVATSLEPWSDADGPRRAGVSSFGIGGTNAHVIVEQPPDVERLVPGRAAQVLVLSAKSAGALDQSSANLADALRRDPSHDLADVAYTLQTGRSPFAHRRMLVSRTSASAVDLLESRDPVRVISGTARLEDPPIAFLFPGGGAQYPRMGLELYETEPVYRHALDRCLNHAPSGPAVRPLLFPPDAELANAARELERPSRSLPALFATEFAVAERLKAFGIRPAAMLGHSMGEYVAACLAGVFTPEEGMALVAKRGELFETLPEGGMLSVPLPSRELAALLGPELSLGAVNGPEHCIASGPARAIDDLEARLFARGVDCTRIHISVAAHSSMLDPILDEFERFWRTIALRKPSIPFVSNLTGTWITDEQATDPTYWVRHLRCTVQFAAGMDTLLASPERLFLEVGPGRTLAGLARQQTVKTPSAFTTMRHPKEVASDVDVLLQAIGRLWVSGASINWRALHSPASRRRVGLPTYPFERMRHWIDPVSVKRPVMPSLDMQGAAMTSARPSAHELSTTPVMAEAGAKPRRDRLVAELKAMLNGMSGVDMAQLDEHATFLALGFDSLFLTQATLALRRQYGVRITFRQLMEELRTIAAVAASLDGLLPQDGLHASPEPSRPAAQARAVPPTPHTLTPKHQPYNPYEPLAKGADSSSLTTEQRAHVDALISRYSKRSARSKQITQQYRQVLADPRTVAGFRSTWKEMIYPTVSTRSSGAYIWDADGNRSIDLMMGYGVNLFGHSPDFVVAAVRAQLERGFELGPQSELAGRIAELVTGLTGTERVTFCNTGSEAVLAAIRVARTVTGRSKIAIFAGSYHGLFDEVLTRSILVGGREQSVPLAPGIPRHMSRDVLVLPYGDPSALDAIRANAGELAAVLVEPVQSRRPDLQPAAFLRELRDVTTRADVPLVFDEMITGFRIHQGGAQAWFDVRADLVTYGKIVGGGLPLAMVAGKAAFMDALDGGAWQFGDDSAPEANLTYFAGTYVRHPLALASSLAVLEQLKQAGPGLQQRLNDRASRLVARLNAILTARALPITILQCGSLFRFQIDPDFTHANLLFFHLRENGVDAWPRFNFFLSTAHSDADLDEVVGAVDRSLDQMQAAGFLPRSGVSAAVPASVAAPAPFPLTEAQIEVWLAGRFGRESSLLFNESGTIRLDGALDEGALARAWRAVIERHEALRTTFAPDASGQRVIGTPVVDMPLVDLSALDPAEREAGRQSLLRVESETPFDLEQGPVVRARLLRYDTGCHELVITAHHLVCDGSSFGTIVRDLAAFYTEDVDGEAANLAAATPFRAFAAWQAEQARLPDDAANETYWKRQFVDEPPILQLPTDRPRSADTALSCAVETLAVSESTLESLKRISTERGCTLFGTLLSAFYALLHRLSGQDDIVVGISSSGQNLMGRHGLVGHCVSFLPIRLRTAATLDAQLQAVRDALLDAVDHQNYTFGRLVRSLTLGRQSGRMPLLSVIFNMDPRPEPLMFGAIRTSERGVPKRFSNVDLFLNAVQVDDGLRLDCTYLTGLYDADTIRRWLRHYECLLEAIVADGRTPVAEVPLMRDTERRQLLDILGGPPAPRIPRHVPVDGAATLSGLFEAQVARTPDAVAISAPDQLTYRQLNAQANRIAHRIRGLNVEPEGLVGLFMERSPALIAGLIGILKAGAAYLPIDVAYPADRLAFVLEDGRAGVVLTERALVEKIPRTTARVICIEDVLAGDADPLHESNPETRATADGLAYVIYTSGTTGKPKGSQITHRNVVRLFAAADVLYAFGERDVWTLFHSHAFDFSVWEIWGALLYGGRLVVVSSVVSRSADAFYDLVADEHVTVLNQTPSAFRSFIQADATRRQRLALRYVIFGGEALDPQALRPWVERHGDEHPRLINMYGITETTVHVTHRRLSSADLTASSVIGVPIPGWKVHLLDEKQQPVPIGVIGEIYVGGAGVSRGYLRRDDLTQARFVPDPFGGTSGARLYRSGDLARYRANGDLEYVGRRDQQLKIRGFRVEPGEIEARLVRHAAVRQSAVVAREDAQGDRTLVAYIVPAAGAVVEPSSLRAHLKQGLPDYMIPAAYVRMESLPLTLNGKLDTRALPRPSRADLTVVSAVVAPRTKTEQWLASIWREMLDVSQIGIQDDFFLLGGHSLLAMQLLDRVHRESGVSLPPGVFFGHSTLAEMASQIDEAGERPSRPPEQRLVSLASGGSGTPFFWAHGVGGEVVSYGRLSEHMAAARPVFGFQPDWSPTKGDETSIEALATQYVKELRAVQPSGPYYLGGFCSAALLALEMARQLEAAGEKVGLLAALDYVIKPTARSFANPADLLAFATNAPRWLTEDAIVSGSREMLARALSRLRRLKRALLNAGVAGAPAVDVRDQLGMWRFPSHSVPMLNAYYTAFRRYEPKPIKGRVTLFLPRTSPLLGPWRRSPDGDWGGIATGGVQTHRVRGSHFTMLIDPFAAALGSLLNEAIEEAEAERRAPCPYPAVTANMRTIDTSTQPARTATASSHLS